MGEMILKLFAIAQQPQMFFGPAEMILDAAPDPFVVRMFGHAVAHDSGDHLERLFEVHIPSSWPLPLWRQAICC